MSGSFSESTQYQGAVRFLNETETPAEEITDEVLEEADEHQVFYTTSEGLNIQLPTEIKILRIILLDFKLH